MPRAEVLTERNRQIRRLSQRGWTTQQIAERLEIARGQVWAVLNAERHRVAQRERQRRYYQREKEAARGDA